MSVGLTIGRLPHLGLRRRLRRLRHAMHLEPIRTVCFLGRPFDYPLDSLIGRTIADGREWDQVLCTVATIALPQDQPVVCDVGSNLGASCLQILKAKPGARVVAVEPSDRFRPLLYRNLQRAGHSQVEVASIVLGRGAGTAWLYNNSSTASIVREEYDGHEPRGRQRVRMQRLDEFWGGRPALDFIKVDTDGLDFEVLRGGEGILRRCHPIVFFELEAHLVTAPVSELQWLQGLGYRQLVCFRPDGALIGATTDANRAIAWAGEHWYCDILAWPSDAADPERLALLLARL